jgi:hypothetical protein
MCHTNNFANIRQKSFEIHNFPDQHFLHKRNFSNFLFPHGTSAQHEAAMFTARKFSTNGTANEELFFSPFAAMLFIPSVYFIFFPLCLSFFLFTLLVHFDGLKKRRPQEKTVFSIKK